jgi:Ca2+-transporting ATPase
MDNVSQPWAMSIEEVTSKLQSNGDSGLSKDEAAKRLIENGPNSLKVEKKASRFKLLLSQFLSPVVLILIAAAIIAGSLGELTDSVAILVIVIVNAIIGFLQEAKAENAINALKKLSAPKAKVLRNSEIIEIKSDEVAMGDILVLEAGDYIPADARLILANQLSVKESVLTGESLPVKKDSPSVPSSSILAERKNMLFGSTAIATGSARAIVTAIGMKSEIGKIAKVLDSSTNIKTPLQKRLEQVSKKLLYLSGAVVLLVAVLGFFHGENWLDILMSAISLAVAAIPEGLPAVVTVSLALAVRRMSKKNAIVRHLPAVETLGSTNVICTDKTGTLTTGDMRVRDIFPVDGQDDNLVLSSVLCSNASLTEKNGATGDPTEIALLYFAKDKKLVLKNVNQEHPRIYEWSFDSDRKRMSVAVRDGDHVTIHTKGAPEAVLERCLLDEAGKKKILDLQQELSSQGSRLLAVASRQLKDFDEEKFKDSDVAEKDLTYLGIISISDPPREETIPAIKACKEAGIKIVMITGDHPETAKAIAKELGIVEEGKFDGVMTGVELEELTAEELEGKVDRIAVYARVSPLHKVKIVEAWQSKGNIVAMTGDGVNDAPALKKASIGISMGKGGTEVARQASSMILTDDNFSTIVSAIKEGRGIFGNIRRTIQYLLSGNLAEILIMLGAAIAGWPAPLAPIHLLWINLVTDGVPSLALAAEPVPKDILKGSVPSSQSFFNKKFYIEMGFVGGMIAVMSLIMYGYMLKTSDEISARTYVFSFLVFAELFRAFACRSENKTFFQMGMFSNVYLLIAVSIPLGFQIFLHHSGLFLDVFQVNKLPWSACFLMIGLTLIPVSIIEMRKYMKQKK